jgi:hypothetical protein
MNETEATAAGIYAHTDTAHGPGNKQTNQRRRNGNKQIQSGGAMETNKWKPYGSGSSPVLFPPVVSTVLFAAVGLIRRWGEKLTQ